MVDPRKPVEQINPGRWQNLYRVGGMAAILAGIIFRRNLGAEAALLSSIKPPASVEGWYGLLQTQRLLGLTYLGIFDVVNYSLVTWILLALYLSHRRAHPNLTAAAAVPGFLGIAVYFASNTALSMLSLSDQYAAASNDTQRNLLLAAGQAVLALNRFSGAGAHPGSGGYLSLLLIAASGLLFSIVILRSKAFKKRTAYIGILANSLDLVFCMAFPFTPGERVEQLALLLIPAAGLGFMIWHLLVGWRLLHLDEWLYDQ